MMRVLSLHLHPLKSGAIITVPRLHVDRDGARGDRRWMLVDETLRFVSQRELPAMARLHAVPNGDGIDISFDGEALGHAVASGERVQATVWRDVVSVATVAKAVDTAISAALGRTVRLVAFDQTSQRTVDREWADDATVGLADGFPLLVATVASLDDLNAVVRRRGEGDVPMSRFRPNIVIEGSEPWADDAWASIRVGDVLLDLVKPCTRCKVTTVDQANGTATSGEPLETLRTIRMSGDRRVPGVLFGWNAVVRSTGMVEVGAEVEVVRRREPWPIRSAV